MRGVNRGLRMVVKTLPPISGREACWAAEMSCLL